MSHGYFGTIIYFVAICVLPQVSLPSLGLSPTCPVLYLLNVEPYPHSGEQTVWDRAFELIPAAHLAAQQVNNRSDILQGRELRIVDIDSEACGLNVISKGVANVYKELTNQNRECIAGIIGLFCSPVTDIISPIVSHPKIGGYVQIAASTSPVHRMDSDMKDSSLFHIIGSSSMFNEATLALMKAFDWHRISVVHNGVKFYQRSIAADFTTKVEAEPDIELVASVPISKSKAVIPQVFDVLNKEEARISYWAVDYRQTSRLLCEAFHKKFLWPGYVYILEEPKLGKILKMDTSCSQCEIMIALEGMFTLQYRLFVNNDTVLFSGLNYSEYKQQYAEKLDAFASSGINGGDSIEENVYANSLYDQVWSFALAINNSLTSLDSHSKTSDISRLTDMLKDELRKLSFQGASGRIQFGDKQESPSYIDIFQYRKGREEYIGTYDPFTQNITFDENYVTTDLPGDTFDTVYHLLPRWLAACILLAQGLLFCLITTNFILMVWWRKEREIKATSPVLSSLMMVGCYLLLVAPIALVMYRSTVIKNEELVTFLCMLKTWVTVGTELIFATLFVRLLRIYRIFCSTPMQIMSDYWEDKYLFFHTLVISSGKFVLLILWNSIDPIHPMSNPMYVYEPDRVPYYMVTLRCTCKTMSPTVWLIVTKLYSVLLLFMVVFMAIQTRHVKKTIYKDTKKVNIFIFLVTVCLATMIPLWLFFLEVGIEVGANVAEWLSLFVIPLSCQVCLFLPKILPVICRKIKSRTRLTCLVACTVNYLPWYYSV